MGATNIIVAYNANMGLKMANRSFDGKRVKVRRYWIRSPYQRVSDRKEDERCNAKVKTLNLIEEHLYEENKKVD